MSKIISARAYANNEVIYLAWLLDSPISECRGFDIKRIDVMTGEQKSLPAWVPFEGQKNDDWQPKDTSVWPIQRLSWKDVTWRDELDNQSANQNGNGALQPIDRLVKYEIIPMVGPAGGMTAKEELSATTNTVHLIRNFGDISVAFNDGILSTQWLTRQLQAAYPDKTPLDAAKTAIADTKSPIRRKLAGDARLFLRSLLDRSQEENATVCLALYELTDPELLPLLLENKDRIRMILSNTSADKTKKIWDQENEPARNELHTAGVQIQDRMFNNDHIGHNKFAVLLDSQGQPTSTLTGSTNWTQNGLCAQSNNAVLIESAEVAGAFYSYWKRLLNDKLPLPDPLTEPTRNVQGPELRESDISAVSTKLDSGKTDAEIWFSPNTTASTKTAKSPPPPDLKRLFDLMSQAKDAILFLVFLPGMHGNQSIIEDAIDLGKQNPSLLVLGAVSSSLGMPVMGDASSNQVSTFLVNSKRTGGRSKPGAPGGAKQKVSPVFAENATEIVQASSLGENDLVGAFEKELLSAGNAIVHDKIVVVDPLSAGAVVAFGSHNLGYKASYGNDENLVIVQGNQALAQAYAVHVLDVYDHYRFRAEQLASNGKYFDGFLKDDDTWQQDYIDGKRGSDAQYFGRD